MAYIIKNKKRITYEFKDGKVVFSDGKTAVPSLDNMNVPVAWDLEDYPVVPTKPVDPPVEIKYRLVGNGSGELQLGNVTSEYLKIKPGSYSSIKFGVVNKCIVDCEGVFSAGVDIFQFNGLELTGLSIVNGTGIYIVNPSSGLKLTKGVFSGIKNNVIRVQNQPTWDGTDATVSKDWTISDCSFKETDSVFSYGSIGPDEKGVYQIKGLFKNFVFTRNTVKDLPIDGSIILMGAVAGYEISANDIDHVNYNFTTPGQPNGKHNGVFKMTGHGSLFGNKAVNCQGNLIRAWGISFSPKVETTFINNNIYYNTSKYGAFEIQVPPELDDFIKASKGKCNYVNCKIFNNTAGGLGKANVLWAQMLDAYTTHAEVEYFNNLGFDMIRDDNQGQHHKDGISDMLVNFSGTPLKRNENNLYFDTWEKAVGNLTTFKSLHPGIGAN